jgi:hypothetical protein
MDSDKKLIELAAKAVGIEHPGGEHCVNGPGVWDCKKMCWWKPLTDDGDAFRLMISANLEVERCKDGSRVYVNEYGDAPYMLESGYEQDIFAATRRAIVMAAADIGRGMK